MRTMSFTEPVKRSRISINPSPIAPERALEGTYTVGVSTLTHDGTTFGRVRIDFVKAATAEKKKVCLIVLCDISSSMAGRRIENLRAGINRFAKLAVDHSNTLEVEMALIAFNDSAELALPMGPIPSNITEITDGLVANGGTSIQAALTMAMDTARPLIEAGKVVNVVLITDGEDSELENELEHERGNSQLVADLMALPYTTVFCVGICAEASKAVLDGIIKYCRRGTMQIIDNNDISKLFGSVFALIYELVPQNIKVTVNNGDKIIRCKEVSCQPPMECSVTFETNDSIDDHIDIKVAFAETSTSYLVGEAMDLSLVPAYMESICAKSAVVVASLLDQNRLPAAGQENAKTRQKLQSILEAFAPMDPETNSAINTALAELDTNAAEILVATTNYTEARLMSMRLQSRADTNERTMSIDPHGRSVSDMQRNLSGN